MAKHLNTTVHLTDPETGAVTVLGPKSRLTAAQRKQLNENWGKSGDVFFDEDEDAEPEDVPQAEHLEAGHPPADSGPAGGPKVEEAQKARAKAREG